MLLEESRKSRRIVGRLDANQDVVDTLTQVAHKRGVESGHYSVTGIVSHLVLVETTPGKPTATEVFNREGRFQIVQLGGAISVFGDELIVDAIGTFVVAGPAGPQIVCGQVKSATLEYGEVCIDAYDDIRVERTANFDEGRLVIDEIVVTESPEPSTPTAAPVENSGEAKSNLSWEQAIETSAAPVSKTPSLAEASSPTVREEADPDEIYAGIDLDEPELSVGDVLNHPKLGTCRVIKVEDECAHIRLPKGQIRKLSLIVCDVEFIEERDGRSIFKVIINP